MPKLLFLVLCLTMPLLQSCAPQTPSYLFTTIGSILDNQENFEGRQVRITGTYLAQENLEQGTVTGILMQDNRHLVIKGNVFDWQPPTNVSLQIWGEVILENDEAIFKFHNGRTLGNIFRDPQPLSPDLKQNSNIEVWGRVISDQQSVLLISENRLQLKMKDLDPSTADLDYLIKINANIKDTTPIDYDYVLIDVVVLETKNPFTN